MTEEAKALLTACGVAIFGGVVRYFNDKEKRSFSKIFIVVLTAAFSGLMAFYITDGLGLSPSLQSAIAGIAGYGGGAGLDEIMKEIKKIFLCRIKNNTF